MGTRSLTRVFEDDTQVVCIYRQMDGYPAGMGQELAEFLYGMKLTNGISAAGEGQRTANGAGCLAAQLVAHFKDGVGNIYIEPTTTVDAGQDYEYEVRTSFGKPDIELRCYDVHFGGGDEVERNLLFSGSPTKYKGWLKKYEAANA